MARNRTVTVIIGKYDDDGSDAGIEVLVDPEGRPANERSWRMVNALAHDGRERGMSLRQLEQDFASGGLRLPKDTLQRMLRARPLDGCGCPECRQNP